MHDRPWSCLAVLAIVAGYLKDPAAGTFLRSRVAVDDRSPRRRVDRDGLARRSPDSLFLAGLGLAYVFHLRKRGLADVAGRESDRPCAPPMLVCRLGLRLALRQAFVRPFVWVANVNRRDFIDAFYTGIVAHR